MRVPGFREQSGLPVGLTLYYQEGPLPFPQKEGSAGRKGSLPDSQRTPRSLSLPALSLYSTEVQQGRLDMLDAADWYHGPEMRHLLLVLGAEGKRQKSLPRQGARDKMGDWFSLWLSEGKERMRTWGVKTGVRRGESRTWDICKEQRRGLCGETGRLLSGYWHIWHPPSLVDTTTPTSH